MQRREPLSAFVFRSDVAANAFVICHLPVGLAFPSLTLRVEMGIESA